MTGSASTLELNDCGDDIECQMQQMPPHYHAFIGQLQPVYRVPDNAGQAAESTRLAMEIFDANPDMWVNWFNHSSCKSVWSAPQFPDFAAAAGLVEYWREVGWPAACQPTAEGFDCGSNIGRNKD